MNPLWLALIVPGCFSLGAMFVALFTSSAYHNGYRDGRSKGWEEGQDWTRRVESRSYGVRS